MAKNRAAAETGNKYPGPYESHMNPNTRGPITNPRSSKLPYIPMVIPSLSLSASLESMMRDTEVDENVRVTRAVMTVR